MIFLHLLFRQIYVVEMILAFVCISVSIQIRRHLHFICYESCPLDAWPETQLPCHDVPEAPHGDDAAGADAEMCRGYQLCQPGRNVDVLQQMPEEAQVV